MAEFCPGCPMAGFYVGPVEPNAFTMGLSRGKYDHVNTDSIVANFIDADDIYSGTIVIDAHEIEGRDTTTFAAKGLDNKNQLAAKLVSRIDRCTGTSVNESGVQCRAIGGGIMKIFISRMFQEENKQ